MGVTNLASSLHDDGLSSSGRCKLGPLRSNGAKISVRVLRVQRPAAQEEGREELFWKAALACLAELAPFREATAVCKSARRCLSLRSY